MCLLPHTMRTSEESGKVSPPSPVSVYPQGTENARWRLLLRTSETETTPAVVSEKMEPYFLHQLHPDFGFKDRSINTLFVSGLPDDVKPREIHNLFRRRPGFESCQLKYTGRRDQVVAFVTFFNHQSAVAALSTVNGVVFDPQSGSALHVELARSNSRRKRKPGGGPYVVIDKRRRTKDDTQDASSEDGDDEHESPQDEDQTSEESGRTAADPDSPKANTRHEHKERNAEGDAHTERNTEGDARSCSTLFIANLGPNCTEEELRESFSQYPGFNVLKLRGRGGMPVAFADFEDTEQATTAMNYLQGSTLSSSDRGGMHIDYARSKMRRAPRGT